jgi:hypothetical protein
MPAYNVMVNNPHWSGGITRCKRTGKIRVLLRNHPRATSEGYVFEHIVVAETALGRFISKEHPIHHVDLNPSNNANHNLVICEDNSYHKLLHQRIRSYLATGRVDYKHCPDCDIWKPQDQFYAQCGQCKPCRDKRHYEYIKGVRRAIT